MMNKQNGGVPASNTASNNQEQLLIQQALHLHQQNKLAEAEDLYRQVLATNPLHPDALCFLGLIAHQFGQHVKAEELISYSLKIKPDNINAHLNLGNIYQAVKRFAEAEQSFETVLKYNPNMPEIWFNLGNLYNAQGKHDQAIKCFKKAISLRKDWADPYIHLGISLKTLLRQEDALEAFRRALELNPDSYEATQNLANLLEKMGYFEEAGDYYQKAYRQAVAADRPEINSILGAAYGAQEDWKTAIEYHEKAVALDPSDANLMCNLADAYNKTERIVEAEELYHRAISTNPNILAPYHNLGSFYQEQARFDEAIVIYKKMIELEPHSANGYLNLAILYTITNKLTEALERIQQALAIDPNSSDAHMTLGSIYKARGDITGALEQYKQAYLLRPSNLSAHSNYIYGMHNDTAITSEHIYQETVAWAAQHTDQFSWMTHDNIPDPMRRLRIGYVSGDFREHAVSFYLEPVLRSHNKSQVEIFCYSNYAREDKVTKRLQSYADHWRNIFRLSNNSAARLIQEDKIDILIDLSGHTAGSRLPLFAYKPAPLQATWIGYFNTTGVKAIDYIITDRFLLPPEEEHLYVEKPLRLPNSGAVFNIHTFPIEVNPLPALTNGHVTFGCFNALSKLTPGVVTLWAEILRKVPSARLYLKNGSFDDEETREQYRKQFLILGVDATRLTFSGFSPMQEYLKSYNDVDLGLDPFPYNGATTTLDSLWMGVPIIVLKGDRLVGHIGESLLGAVGLEEFIGASKAEYVEKAITMANNVQRLAEVRRTLRQTLTTAPITNPLLFTQGLEAAFRDIWKKWCHIRQEKSE